MIPRFGVVAAGLALISLCACSDGRQEGVDKMARSYASGSLRDDLEAGLKGVPGSGARATKAEALLGGGATGLVPLAPYSWEVRARKGATIPVVVYFYEHETTLDDPIWGRACVDFVIGGQVSVKTARCSGDVPASPGPHAVVPPL